MKIKKDGKQTCNRYSSEFKKPALKGAEKDGAGAAARDLGIKETQLCT